MSSLESLSPLQLTSLTDQYSNTTRQKHATYMNIHHGGWGVTMQEQRYNESRLRLGAFARKDVSFATQVVLFCQNSKSRRQTCLCWDQACFWPMSLLVLPMPLQVLLISLQLLMMEDVKALQTILLPIIICINVPCASR